MQIQKFSQWGKYYRIETCSLCGLLCFRAFFNQGENFPQSCFKYYSIFYPQWIQIYAEFPWLLCFTSKKFLKRNFKNQRKYPRQCHNESAVTKPGDKVFTESLETKEYLSHINCIYSKNTMSDDFSWLKLHQRKGHVTR